MAAVEEIFLMRRSRGTAELRIREHRRRNAEPWRYRSGALAGGGLGGAPTLSGFSQRASWLDVWVGRYLKRVWE